MARDESRFGENSKAPQGDPYADVAGSASRVDIGAVIHDDALIDAIASDGPITTSSADEYQLASLLADWRAEINAVPIPDTLDFDRIADLVDREVSAVTTMHKSTSTRTRKVRYLRPIAGAAAVMAIFFGGLTALSYQSSPGDTLWGVKSVVFSQQAESTVANIDSSTALSKAEALVTPGTVVSANTVQQAQQLLDSATAASGEVTDPSQRADLEQWLQRLQAQVGALLALLPPIPVAVAPAAPPVDAAPEASGSGPIQTTVPLTSAPSAAATPPAPVTPSSAPPVTAVTVPPTVDPSPSSAPQSSTTTSASGPVGGNITTTSVTASAGS